MTDLDEVLDVLRGEIAAGHTRILLTQEQATVLLRQFDPAEDDDRWTDWAAMQNAHEKGIMRVGDQVVRIPDGMLGCCLLKLYRQMRDSGAPQEGARFTCTAKCRRYPTLYREWVIQKGRLVVATDNPIRS